MAAVTQAAHVFDKVAGGALDMPRSGAADGREHHAAQPIPMDEPIGEILCAMPRSARWNWS
jgi:hypothetical protein